MRRPDATTVLGVALAAALVPGVPARAEGPEPGRPARAVIHLAFDGVVPGALPAGWRVEATNPRGPLAAWAVEAEAGDSGGNRVLRVRPAPGARPGTFNLCWTRAIRFRDGTIEVRLRAERGEEDRGGGPVWRVQDRDDYYVARYNPLERNFRVYVVRRGIRRRLAGASGIRIPGGRWCTLRIAHHGDHIEGWLDGERLLDVHDATIPAAGGVGLWSKADAATAFDDLEVRVEAP